MALMGRKHHILYEETKEESEGGSVGGKSLREAIKGRESFAKPT